MAKAKQRRAGMRHGQLKECLVHKRKRSYKTRVSQPTNKCPVCWACWFADRTETMLYEDDIADLIKFSNVFQTVLKPSSIEFVEEEVDD